MWTCTPLLAAPQASVVLTFYQSHSLFLSTSTITAAVIAFLMQNTPFAGDVDLHTIARGTPGFSGADLLSKPFPLPLNFNHHRCCVCFCVLQNIPLVGDVHLHTIFHMCSHSSLMLPTLCFCPAEHPLCW
jgi:hypothetical protein